MHLDTLDMLMDMLDVLLNAPYTMYDIPTQMIDG